MLHYKCLYEQYFFRSSNISVSVFACFIKVNENVFHKVSNNSSPVDTS